LLKDYIQEMKFVFCCCCTLSKKKNQRFWKKVSLS